MNIQQMVNEYNEIEQQQQARLLAIFAAVKARQGFRRVNFAGDVTWSNCWESPDSQNGKYFGKLQRAIIELIEGAE